VHATAVTLQGPKDLVLASLQVAEPQADELVVDVTHSGISTGTEKLFWTGEMPPFPGMGYPLVPGYEAAGEVVEAGPLANFKSGDRVARLTIASGAPAPTVWEVDASRSEGATSYEVLHPDDDTRRDYQSIYDASGQADILGDLIGRIVKGGEIVLAGFYAQPISFAFPPAFMKEARLRVAAEWTPQDLTATRALVESGALSLDGLITHRAAASEAHSAYKTAFTDTTCLKMILDWEGTA